MANEILVFGSESSVIYYNLNKQFSTLKRLIVTSDEILGAFQNNKAQILINEIAKTEKENFNEKLIEIGANHFEDDFKDEFYQKIQEKLEKLYDTFAEVKLKDYNFMSAVSNTKFTVCLRCENYSISSYFNEKGVLLSSIKKLVKDYLNCPFNKFRTSRIENFQIEIFESEEVYKHIYLKKEGSSLVLASSFGFPRSKPIDYLIGPELYYSKGEEFSFFKNDQSTGVLRTQNKIEENEINVQEKVLSNEDLVEVNKITKNINDAIVELYINRKGNIRITNVSLLENSVQKGNNQGFIINRSRNNYDRISMLTLRDNSEEEYPNPKYLIIRNQEEVRELFENLSRISNYDGIIFGTNFYEPIFDRLGLVLNIDILFYKSQLQKSLDVKIDFDEISIEGSSNKESSNPFSSIIGGENKEKDELLERLKNIDLNTTPREQNQAHQNQSRNNEVNAISSLAEGLISSPQASTSRQASSMNWPTSTPSLDGGKKKSAIGMLADSVINNNNQPVKEETQVESKPTFNEQEVEEIPKGVEPTNYDNSNPSNTDSFIMDITSKDLNPLSQETLDNVTEVAKSTLPKELKIITTPSVESGSYFVDSNTISQIKGGEIFYLVLDSEEMKNPNVKYILPISLSKNDNNNCFLLVNNTNDFFMIKDNSREYFLNLTHVDQTLRENFLKSGVEKLGNISLIALKEQADMILPYIKNVNMVFFKDLHSKEELDFIKNKLGVQQYNNPFY